MKKLSKLLKKVGLIKEAELKEKLAFAKGVSRRLDEHRKFVDSLTLDTNLFQTHPVYIQQMAEQDNYLMNLFYLLHGFWPEPHRPYKKGYIRSRPKILGEYEPAKKWLDEDDLFIKRYAA